MKVDQSTLAEFFSVSKRTIRSWQSAGMPREGSRNRRRYDTRDCLEWWAANRLDLTPDPSEENGLPTTEESERRWKLARARLKEVEVRERREELVEFDAIVALVEDVLTRVRTKLLHLPGRRIAEVTAETDKAAVREIRMESVREILEETQELLLDAAPEEEKIAGAAAAED